MTTIPSVTLLLHPGSRREYTVTVPSAPHIYTPTPLSRTSMRAVVPYKPSPPTYTTTSLNHISYKPSPNQPDSWTLRVPDFSGDGYHKWEYAHLHAAATATLCQCRRCIYAREEERERELEREREREWEREREMDRMVLVRREERRLPRW